ncbi:MAG: glycosyltransferase family 8 protein [Treponema sp.]|nr:glycosyltransferase family 8 protein [Treponema sp.]
MTDKHNKNIVLCFNPQWIMQASVLITSILHYNSEEFIFHIIGKGFSSSDILTIQKYAKSCPVIFHDIGKIDTSDFIIRDGDHVTIETYYRFFIPEFLEDDIDKCLYLDCDIVCTGNIDRLFKVNLDDYACGMVYDILFSDIRISNRLRYDVKYGYYNAGVMLINLEYWRKNNTKKQLIEFVKEYPERCRYHDQDAVNYICHGKILSLPVSYNVQRVFWRVFFWKDPIKYSREPLRLDFISREKWNEIEGGCKNPLFVHFTEKQKPWILDTFVPFTKVWKAFLARTEFSLKFQLRLRIKIFIKTIIGRPFDDNYPPEAYEIENNLLTYI